jgi:prepilin-type N-terminal cleavage/methylation domain-containing protein
MEENINKKGFTLVEVLTSIFIIAILSAVILVNYRQSNRQYALLRSANKLAQDIRRAQQMAMTTKEYGGSIPPGGYGIYINTGDTSYILYADNNPADPPGGNEIYEPGDFVTETINFESGVSVQSVNPSPLSVNFKPPDPTTKISNGASEMNEGVITLTLQSKTKTIKVNKSGLVWVE